MGRTRSLGFRSNRPAIWRASATVAGETAMASRQRASVPANSAARVSRSGVIGNARCWRATRWSRRRQPKLEYIVGLIADVAEVHVAAADRKLLKEDVEP